MLERSDGYISGQWKANCDRCGKTYLARDLAREWTGLRVCRSDCLDSRHPQEILRAKADRQSVPWARPDSEGVDVSPGSGNEVSAEDL